MELRDRLLAVKRDQAALDSLLADDGLLAAVPNGLGRALRSGEGDPTFLLQTYGVEVFLVALSRALDSKCPDLFTGATMEQVWSLYSSGASSGNGSANASRYSAEHIITELSAANAVWLPAWMRTSPSPFAPTSCSRHLPRPLRLRNLFRSCRATRVEKSALDSTETWSSR